MKLIAFLLLFSFSAQADYTHLPMKTWFDDTGWLHYHPDWDPRQKTDGFGDSPHHTGFYFTKKILDGTLTDKERALFIYGFHQRMTKKGLARHPRTKLPDGSYQLCNRDQLTAILFPIRVLIGKGAARKVYEKANMIMWPHQWLHMQRQMGEEVGYLKRVAYEMFEIGDTVFDGIEPNNSSIVKNKLRYELAEHEQPTFMTGSLTDLLEESIDIPKVFKEYFTFQHENEDYPTPVHVTWGYQ